MVVSTPPITLRPQAFSTSRRFAPQVTCQVYFTLVPPLGFLFQGFRLQVKSYVLSNAAASLRLLAHSGSTSEDLVPSVRSRLFEA